MFYISYLWYYLGISLGYLEKQNMKIAVIGYSGSGKSTLATKLGEHYKVDVLHFDSVQFLPGWIERKSEEKQQIINDFLNNHNSWVIDGNYTKLSFERRMQEADLIVMLLFSPLDCLLRVIKRYKKYKGTTRPDLQEGCLEKIDWNFIKWVLWECRTKPARKRYKDLQKQHPDKVVVLKNQKEMDKFLGKLC